MKQINIKHVTNLHSDCLRGLSFYDQELTILQQRLEEIAAANTHKEVLEKIEHFQNQFIIHRNYIDELTYSLHANLNDVESEIVSTAGFIAEDTCNDNENLYRRYIDEEKVFNELRHEFNRFAADWM